MGRLSNTELRKQSLRGCRYSRTATEAWGFIDAARRCGDRKWAERIRRNVEGV